MKRNRLTITLAGLMAASGGAFGQEAPQTVTSLPVTKTETPSAFSAEPLPGGDPFQARGKAYQIWNAGREENLQPVSTVFFHGPNDLTVDETAEDLRIMSLLLAKNLDHVWSEAAPDYKLGIQMLFAPNERSAAARYIEGFGAIFDLKVRYPLLPPSEGTKTGPPEQRTSEWERARRELDGVPQTPEPEMTAQDWVGRQSYDVKLVETLKSQVLETLRNAANLRHVEPNEWVVVNVIGPGRNAGGMGSGIQSMGNGFNGILRANPKETGRTTMMTIRVKKEMADAVAAKKMTAEEFFKKAEVAIYSGKTAAE